MIRTRELVPTGVLLAGAVFLPGAIILSAEKSASAEKTTSAAAATAHGAAFDPQTFWQTTKVYCDTCHFGPKAKAKLNLENLDLARLDANGETWEKVLRKLRSREMPPIGMPRPTEVSYNALVSAIENERDRVAQTRPNPGPPTLHPLNRTEYANAIRDLLALEIDVAELLPADDIGYGFDNIGDVLSVSPLLMERYLATARKISRTAVGDPSMPPSYQAYAVNHGLKQLDRMSEGAPVG